jgi:DNA-binding beta-propeller fold protein YncE
MVSRLVPFLLCALTAAGCGSAGAGDLPPAATPASAPAATATPDGRVVAGAAPVPGRRSALADHGRRRAVVAPRERMLEVFDTATGELTGQADAGVGPTHVVSDGGGYLFVTDTAGGALLVFHMRPRLELIRRYPLPGSPYGIAIDNRRHRIFVAQTARNQLTELIAGGRPSLVRRYATPRQPDGVDVDEATGRVTVAADGVRQLLDP